MRTSRLIMTACLAAASVTLSCRTGDSSDGEIPDTLRGASAPGVTMTGAGETGTVRETLSRYGLDSSPDAVLTLPSSLREVSGIAFSNDGRLFAHNDERGTVIQVDTSTGNAVKQFAVGERRIREDLEDITVAGDTFYLVNSSGELFAFAEGRDLENVPYAGYPTPLGPRHDIEGLCFDPGTGSLLLACKGDPGTGARDERAVYAFDTGKRTLLPSPRFLISLGELKQKFGLKEFMPSGIGRHPSSGNFYVISSVGNSLIEISPGGKVLSYAALPKKYHEQPEGIAFDGNGRLFISNEGTRKGKIAVYGYAGE